VALSARLVVDTKVVTSADVAFSPLKVVVEFTFVALAVLPPGGGVVELEEKGDVA
jgi:hypothetical protein